jgi:hypothetical protein
MQASVRSTVACLFAAILGACGSGGGGGGGGPPTGPLTLYEQTLLGEYSLYDFILLRDGVTYTPADLVEWSGDLVLYDDRTYTITLDSNGEFSTKTGWWTADATNMTSDGQVGAYDYFFLLGAAHLVTDYTAPNGDRTQRWSIKAGP